jgi:hypothetical protein
LASVSLSSTATHAAFVDPRTAAVLGLTHRNLSSIDGGLPLPPWCGCLLTTVLALELIVLFPHPAPNHRLREMRSRWCLVSMSAWLCFGGVLMYPIASSLPVR